MQKKTGSKRVRQYPILIQPRGFKEMTEENQTGETGLAAYKGYRQQVKEFEIINSTIVFDYESKKGNKEARSHIAKMKRSKAAVEKVRIAEAKIYREALNMQAETIKSDIDKMILIHQKPLDDFENKEKIRIAAIEKRINDIFERNAGTTADEIQKEIDYVNLIDLDDGWEELLANAITAVTDRLKFLNDRLIVRQQYEADQAELEKLRKEKEDREAKELADREAEALADKKLRDNAPIIANNSVSKEYMKEAFPLSSRGELQPFDDEVPATTDEPKQRRSELNEPVTEGGDPLFHGVSGGVLSTQRKPREDSFNDAVKTKTVKEKRLEAEEDLFKIGFSKEQATLLIRSISFGKIRNIKFDL